MLPPQPDICTGWVERRGLVVAAARTFCHSASEKTVAAMSEQGMEKIAE
jgi:hypothetical protein